MSHEYTENELIQNSAGNLLHDELKWDVHFAYNQEVLGENGTFGRISYEDILLSRYFRAALKNLNSWIDERQISQAETIFKNRLSTASLMQINEEKYHFIRDGIPVSVQRPDGKSDLKRAIVIDFAHPDNNSFLAIKELKIHSSNYRRRTDIVGFVNGIPLLFIELKRFDVDVQNAYTDNYSDYLDTIPHLFYYNAFLMLSNGCESKIGTLGSKYEFFHEWKRLSEDDEGSVALETMLRGVCKKENFLDLLQNFILYDHSNGKTVKILARNHQYLGVNEAVKAYEARRLNNGKLGVFWHTQGSGKSYSMVFLSQKIRRTCKGSPTIVILTDREELNKQISDTFENCGLLGKTKASGFIATSGQNLVQKLKGNPAFIFTLIQKFNLPDAQPIHPDHDILIMSDEAHRSQYGVFAENMMNLLPESSRIGFTGTPLLSDDNITARTFGGYISVYDFKRAVEDGATVPLYYENRGDKIEDIKNPEISDKILDAIEKADFDTTMQDKLEAEFSKEIHILTTEKRLKAVARDFAAHYSDLWTSGKAMFVCLNKVTCVRMYNYVQEYWQEEIKKIEFQMKKASQQEYQELERKLRWMKETEMAVVISQEQNEIQTFRKWNLDIQYHRTKMEKRELDTEFKDSENPLRIVFVCAMWLTGFDVKSLSCLYLDKPLKAHALMQTIARANRVAEGKSNGLIIDYVGIVRALRKALADYTVNLSGKEHTDPTIDKEKLIEQILDTVSKAKEFLAERDYQLSDLVKAKDFRKVERLQAAEAACMTIEDRKVFMTYGAEISRLIKYTDRDDLSFDERSECNAIIAIYHILQRKHRHVDITDLMVEVNSIINEYIDMENQPYIENKPSIRIDISKIDFTLLSQEFSKIKKVSLVFHDIEALIQQKLNVMIAENPNRIDYYERYQKIISDYNREQDRATIEKTFVDLIELARSLDDEQKRYIREKLNNEEELAVYDILYRPELSKVDITTIKAIAIELLQKIKTIISTSDHWLEKQETKAAVDNVIRDILWNKLPECYDDNSISDYRKKIGTYIYERFKGVA